MSEKIFDAQKNYGWGLTFNLTGKAPAINKRIFDTLNDAQSFVDDINDSAVEGLLLSVVSDENENNNGVYFVKSIKKTESDESSILLKVTTISELESLISEIEGNISDLETSLKEDVMVSVNVVKETIGEIESGVTVVDLIGDVKTSTESNLELINSNKSEIDNYTINEKVISDNPVLSSNDLLIGEGYYTINPQSDEVVEGDALTNAIKKLEVIMTNTMIALTAAVNDLESKIGNPSVKDDNGLITHEATGLYKKYEELYEMITE